MRKLIPILLCLSSCAMGQRYTSASIFAHNDYVQPNPFYTAYHHKAGFIEADVFLFENDLVVAHTFGEIDKRNSLERLYLEPLVAKVRQNNGFAYDDKARELVLMIDLKSDGVPTLDALVDQVGKFTALTSCPTFQLVISGNVPDTSRWDDYPLFVCFDGRPGIQYSVNHLRRISFISSDFRKYSTWNGEGSPLPEDLTRIKSVCEQVHGLSKRIRFWGTPDSPNGWMTLMKLNVDIIGTDRVSELSTFLNEQ